MPETPYLPPEAAPASGGNRRLSRLASLLKREIAVIVAQELRDPRIGFVTITRVELTVDLQHCTAFYTLLGPVEKRGLAQHALDRATGFVQRGYAKVVRTRTLPRLQFVYDDREEKHQRMEGLIDQARASDPHPQTGPQPPQEP